MGTSDSACQTSRARVGRHAMLLSPAEKVSRLERGAGS